MVVGSRSRFHRTFLHFTRILQVVFKFCTRHEVIWKILNIWIIAILFKSIPFLFHYNNFVLAFQKGVVKKFWKGNRVYVSVFGKTTHPTSFVFDDAWRRYVRWVVMNAGLLDDCGVRNLWKLSRLIKYTPPGNLLHAAPSFLYKNRGIW